MRRWLLIVSCVALVLAVGTGCAKRHKIEIQSDGCWEGAINDNKAVQGCGGATYKVIGKLQCVRLQKDNTAGYLRVRIDSRDWSETTTPNGFVQSCN